MTNMFRIIYISEIDTQNFDSQTLIDIMKVAKKNNATNHITGVLIFDYSHFLQVLEGSNEAVSQTFVKIVKDLRHKNLRLVVAHNSEHRCFENWDMECKELVTIVENDSLKICDMSIEEIEALLSKIREVSD